MARDGIRPSRSLDFQDDCFPLDFDTPVVLFAAALDSWSAVQKANLEGMSVRQMARELGLHRDTVRRYIDAESPPTRRSP